MKKILLLLAISITSYSQTISSTPWTVIGLTTVGQSLGIVSTFPGNNGTPKGVIGLISGGTTSITGSGPIIVNTIPGGYSINNTLTSNLTVPTTYSAASFGGTSYINITSSKKIAYIEHNNDRVNGYFENQNAGTITLDIGFIPSFPVNVYFYKDSVSAVNGSTIIGSALAISYNAIPFSPILTFNSNFKSATTLTGNITFSGSSITPVQDVIGRIIIDGDNASTVTFPANWSNSNGNTFDNSKRNTIYFEYTGLDYFYSIVKSTIQDITPPSYVSGIAYSATKNILRLTYSETLNTTIIPAVTDFTVSNGKTLTGVALQGNTVYLIANANYAPGDVIVFSYTPGTNKIQDPSGNIASSLTGITITSNIVSNAPITVSGIQVWYDASQNITVTGSNINVFTDFSGNNNTATQSTSTACPYYLSNESNFFPSIFFDGNADFLQMTNNINLGDFTIITINRTAATNNPSLQTYLSGNFLFSSGNHEFYHRVVNNTIDFGIKETTTPTFTQLSTSVTDSYPYFVSIIKRSGNTFSYQKGATSLTLNIDQGTGSSSTNTLINTIGAFTRSPIAQPFNGYFRELVIYNRQLTSTEITNILSYYNSKYGL